MTTKRKSSPPAKRRTRTDKQAAAAMMARLREGKDLRARKARHLRAVIRMRRYENNLKLQVALDRMMGEI